MCVHVLYKLYFKFFSKSRNQFLLINAISCLKLNLAMIRLTVKRYDERFFEYMSRTVHRNKATHARSETGRACVVSCVCKNSAMFLNDCLSSRPPIPLSDTF